MNRNENWFVDRQKWKEFYFNFTWEKPKYETFMSRVVSWCSMDDSIQVKLKKGAIRIAPKRYSDEVLVYSPTKEDKKVIKKLNALYYSNKDTQNNLRIHQRLWASKEELITVKVEFLAWLWYDYKKLCELFWKKFYQREQNLFNYY